jgi:hypothetical protein
MMLDLDAVQKLLDEPMYVNGVPVAPITDAELRILVAELRIARETIERLQQRLHATQSIRTYALRRAEAEAEVERLQAEVRDLRENGPCRHGCSPCPVGYNEELHDQ